MDNGVECGKLLGIGEYHLRNATTVYNTIDYGEGIDLVDQTTLNLLIGIHEAFSGTIAVVDRISENAEHSGNNRFARADSAGDSCECFHRCSIMYSALSTER